MSDDVEANQPKENQMGKQVITTSHRGVFAGDITDVDGTTVTVEGVRMCVSWSADVRGVLGLASHGPTKSCRVTRAVEGATVLHDVTGMFPMSGEAVAAWEAEPWQ